MPRRRSSTTVSSRPAGDSSAHPHPPHHHRRTAMPSSETSTLRPERHDLVDAAGLVRVLHRVSGIGVKSIVRRVGSRHAAGSAPCSAASLLPAALSAAHSSVAQRLTRCPCRSSAVEYLPLTLLAEHRPEVLATCTGASRRTGRPGGVSKRLIRPVELVAQLRCRGGRTCAGVGEALPGGVEDRRARVVDLAVEVGVDAAAARVVPCLQQRRPSACDSASGALPLAQHRLAASARTGRPRTSSVAAALAAASTLASVGLA